MNQKVQIERHVGGQEQIEDVVGIERQRVRIARQRLPARIGEVPVRNLAGPKRKRGQRLDGVMRREVVAVEEEAECGDERSRRDGDDTDREPGLEPRSRCPQSS